MISRILLAADGSPSAADAASLAAEIAGYAGAEVIVLSVAQPVTFGDFVPTYPGFVDEPEKLARAEADRQTRELRKAGLKASSVVATSPSVDGTIVEMAERMSADLVVMGTHGRSGLARAILGSVADRVLRGSTVPVLLARHEEPR